MNVERNKKEGAPKAASDKKPKLEATWVRQLIADEISDQIGSALKRMNKDLRVAVMSQVESLLRQELGNLARARAPPTPRSGSEAFLVSGERIVRAKEFRFRAGIEKTLFFELQKKGGPYYDPTFPQKHQITPGGTAVGYLETDVQLWISQRPKKAKE